MPLRPALASLAICVLLAGAGAAAAQPEAPVRAVQQHNLAKDKLAIDGYDPVAYFPEGGGKPAKGDPKFELTHAGARYRFANQANLDAFKKSPETYEPAHGGWCTYAMGESGDKVEIDPKSYVVENGRLFLFYKDLFTDTRARFLKDKQNLLSKADANWKKTSGESARHGASLKAKLQQVSDSSAARMGADMIKKFEQSVEQVRAQGVEAKALKVGAAAPDFELPEARGKTVSLSAMTKEGPVVLVWYRGAWCPYCNLQLASYQEHMDEFKAMGARLIAISPQLPDGSLSAAEKNELEFSVVSDVGNQTARKYGLVYDVPPAVREMYKTFVPKANGDESMQLPLSAVYVVGKDGKIRWAQVDADYRSRPEPEDVLKAVKDATN